MKILCASLFGPGHAHPMLAVARALARRGHDVVVATGPEHEHEAAAAGCEWIDLPHTPGSPQTALRPYEDSAGFAEAFAPTVAALKPDVAVVDLITLGAALACEMNAVPHATLSIHGLHLPSRDLPPFGWGAPPARTPLGKLRDAWMKRANIKDLERARDSLNRIRVRLGLEPTSDIGAQLSRDLVLIATLPALELPRSDWPDHAYVVGPCLWDATGDMPPEPDGDGPLALVALSTAHEHGDLLATSLAAIERSGLRAIVTTGKSEPPRSVPRGVLAVRFAPHDTVMPRCDVVVCTGGHGVVARALVHGVPLVVVPGHGDQRENGYRVERAGAGLRVLKPTVRSLSEALDAVARDPRYRAAARAIAADAATLDGPARATELVEALGTGMRDD